MLTRNVRLILIPWKNDRTAFFYKNFLKLIQKIVIFLLRCCSVDLRHIWKKRLQKMDCMCKWDCNGTGINISAQSLDTLCENMNLRPNLRKIYRVKMRTSILRLYGMCEFFFVWPRSLVGYDGDGGGDNDSGRVQTYCSQTLTKERTHFIFWTI